MTQRTKAVLFCIKYGLLPWWFYEKKKHYDCSYWEHLRLNITYALRWLRGKETEDDIEFEKTTNKNP
jgi:hypothetical protein